MGQLMEAIAVSNELDVFRSDCVQDLIEFKWNMYARAVHMSGFYFHFSYIFMQAIFINSTYLAEGRFKDIDGKQIEFDQPPVMIHVYLILGLLFYSAFYEVAQLCRAGLLYFFSASNFIDLSYVLVGYYNMYCQLFIGTSVFWCKLIFVIVIILSLMKTFYFMKIFMDFSYVVTMIYQVVFDLKSFLLFYFILVVFLSIILDVILMSNPDPNYKAVGPFSGNILALMRISLGDFDFTEL